MTNEHKSVTRVLGFSQWIVLLYFVVTAACAQQNGGEQANKCFVLKPLVREPLTDRSAMCQALEDNLNEYCSGPSPMWGLQFSPRHPEFQLPQWNSVLVSENVQLLEGMVRGRAYASETRNRGVPGQAWSLVEQQLNDPARAPARLRVAQVDIMNRGVSENVYELWPNTCDASIGPAAMPHNLLERHAQILTTPEWLAAAKRGETSFPGQAAVGNAVGNIFLYEGTAFLFLWPGLDPAVLEISSDRFGNVGRFAVCDFDYQPNTRR